MTDKQKPVGLMVRLPPDLHEQLQAFAQGSDKRPPTSLNLAVVFLLRVGLAQQQRNENADESGDSLPMLLAA
ncbi:MAG TPA: hypothetical protein VFS21_03430 [Roseiflexaceae bacterium]|nr:hypothetical protein [Roseiflexaceae bacterium]